ncbi:GNAT family N-acetyltransferase [Pedobacter sp. JCM 36344]|uniref:GNAT family N-acetyltransferase n=1 Tax=Pedobacter sp. JCM 36344 TaxID=3374280 RepID=UPI00397A21C7
MSANQVQIEQVRYELTWRIRHEVMYPNLPFEAIKLPSDPDGIHFGLYANDQLTSVVSIFNEGSIYQFRKFATLDPFQSKGYGSMLLSYIIAYIRQDGGNKLWCNARLSAIKFYERFGFSPFGEPFSEHGIDFVIMELQLETEVDS